MTAPSHFHTTQQALTTSLLVTAMQVAPFVAPAVPMMMAIAHVGIGVGANRRARGRADRRAYRCTAPAAYGSANHRAGPGANDRATHGILRAGAVGSGKQRRNTGSGKNCFVHNNLPELAYDMPLKRAAGGIVP
jgi:hypothetical protein